MADIYPKNGDSEHAADYGYGTARPVQADIPAYPSNRGRRNGGVAAGILAVLGLILSKLSYVGLLLLKFKGLWFTVVSTGVTALIYAQLFGWAFGVGIVLLILIHESGHVVVARIMGMPVTLPVMIPFLGAFVSMKQQPRTVAQESIMAIGGPVLGSIAAGLCYAGYLSMPDSSTGRLLQALAYFGFLINLFNLIPVSPLDGGRIVTAFTRTYWVIGYAVGIGALLATRSPLLLIVLLVGLWSLVQRWRHPAPGYDALTPRQRGLIALAYAALILALVATLSVGATEGPGALAQ